MPHNRKGRREMQIVAQQCSSTFRNGITVVEVQQAAASALTVIFCSFRACASRSPKLTESLSSLNVHFIINDYVRKRQTKICFVGKRFCCFFECLTNKTLQWIFRDVIRIMEQCPAIFIFWFFRSFILFRCFKHRRYLYQT